MNGYVKSALFIYDEEGKEYEDAVVNNPRGVTVISVSVEEFTEKTAELLSTFSHLLVAAELGVVKKVMQHAIALNLTMGLLPLPKQKTLKYSYLLPKDVDEMVSLGFCTPQVSDKLRGELKRVSGLRSKALIKVLEIAFIKVGKKMIRIGFFPCGCSDDFLTVHTGCF